MAVETSEEKAFELKNKYGIEGKFVVLSDNETKIMNNVLQFSSYPSHFLLAPNNIVIDDPMGILSGNDLDKGFVEKMRKNISGNESTN